MRLHAPAQLADKLGIEITPVSIGPGEPYEDPYGTWAELWEISDGGAHCWSGPTCTS